MLLAVLPSVAFAAEDTEKQVRFITDIEGLWGIDFSGVIQDEITINKGKIVLDNPGDTDEDREGILDFVEIDENGVARFFSMANDGEKVYDYIPLGIYTWEAELRAVNGNLFDDVASYVFSLKDVYESLGAETFWVDNHPLVKVTKKDGDVVKEMEFCFAPAESSILPLTVDMDKEIGLTAYLYGGIQCTFTLVPVKYDNGVLTVSVRNKDGSEGAALHEGVVVADGVNYGSFYSFDFVVPHGLFRYKNMVSEGFWTSEYTNSEIWGIPVQEIVNIRMPKMLMRIAEVVYKAVPTSMYTLFLLTLIPVIYPFPITRVYRAVRKSFAAYGIDLGEMAKDSILSGRLKDAIADMLQNLFN